MTQLTKIATLDLGGYPAYVYYTGWCHRIFIDERVEHPNIQFLAAGGELPAVLEVETLADRLEKFNQGREEFKAPPCPECGAEVEVEPFEIQDQHKCTKCDWYVFIRKPEELP
ncbi:MAG: hypothetical protein G3M70_07160 [Candidatus Nitronauta litoralis]|uniref:Uncharacterized protein n=1 Tax=Candidatus Nitronauta litoralis TaxID=2705533 RepID=A0A7T0BVE0_9BACT|nr:MAG: hypothetical protein G3M70_07160 [Candidatus Nitronauta litoralis]